MTKSNLFQKSPPAIASGGVSRALHLVCRRSDGIARHGGGETFEQPACVWINKERRVFALLFAVGALVDLDAAKAGAAKSSCVHLRGFLWSLEVRPDQPEVIRAKLLPGDFSFGCLFYREAVFRAWNATGIAVLPLANLRRVLYADPFSKARNRKTSGCVEVFI